MKRKAIAVLLLGAFTMSLVACGSSENLEEKEEKQVEEKANESEDVTISATDETDDSGTVFTIETNLPEGTILMLSLDGDDYTGQSQVTVEGGKAVSEAFSNNGEPLKGDFSLTVTTVNAQQQPDEVQEIIGADGENLTGELVSENTIGGNNAKETFDFSF